MHKEFTEKRSACKSIVECRLSALGGSIESVNKLMEFYESHLFLAGLGYGLELAFDIIGNQPTADVVEVVHGEWLPDYETFVDEWERESEPIQTGWVCSLCGRQEFQQEPYCNCGAKMDGKKVQDDL